MSAAEPDRFADEVLSRVARQERRRWSVVAGLIAAVLVLAVPAVVALRAGAALDAGAALARAGLGQAVASASDNPVFWAAVGTALVWGLWLAHRASGGRRG